MEEVEDQLRRGYDCFDQVINLIQNLKIKDHDEVLDKYKQQRGLYQHWRTLYVPFLTPGVPLSSQNFRQDVTTVLTELIAELCLLVEHLGTCIGAQEVQAKIRLEKAAYLEDGYDQTDDADDPADEIEVDPEMDMRYNTIEKKVSWLYDRKELLLRTGD